MIVSEKPDKISSSLDVALITQAILAAEHETDQEREHFWAIGLNTGNKIKYIELVSLGGLDRVCITPRETFRLAMMRACKSIIVCHNHPGGNTIPSMEDDLFTKQLREAGEILGIRVLDHIIIGDKTQKHLYYSFADAGRINDPANLSKQTHVPKITCVDKFQKTLERCEKVSKRIEKARKDVELIKARLDKRDRLKATVTVHTLKEVTV